MKTVNDLEKRAVDLAATIEVKRLEYANAIIEGKNDPERVKELSLLELELTTTRTAADMVKQRESAKAEKEKAEYNARVLKAAEEAAAALPAKAEAFYSALETMLAKLGEWGTAITGVNNQLRDHGGTGQIGSRDIGIIAPPLSRALFEIQSALDHQAAYGGDKNAPARLRKALERLAA